MSKNRAQVAFGSPFTPAQPDFTHIHNWIGALAKAQVESQERLDRIESLLAALAAPKGPKAAPKEPKVAPKGPKAAPKEPKVKVFKATENWSPTAAQRAYYLANKAKFKKDREAYLAAKEAGLVA